MENQNYYFIKPYDERLPKPPAESFSQILNETYLHPFNWKARTTRKSYWLSVLTNFILTILAIGLIYYGNNTENLGLKWIDYVVAAVVFIWNFLAGLGQLIRRLHDVNYSGYWYWVSLVPYGSFFLLYLSLQPSAQRAVRWGDYLFSQNTYGEYHQDLDKPNIPIPTIGQILKEHFFDCFKWNARSTRTSYWVGTAVTSIVGAILVIPFYLMAFLTALVKTDDLQSLGIGMIIWLVIMIIGLIWLLLAQLGHTVRRLHDAGFTGWWYWISLVPYIGGFLLAFLLFHPTTKNKIGWNGYLNEDK